MNYRLHFGLMVLLGLNLSAQAEPLLKHQLSPLVTQAKALLVAQNQPQSPLTNQDDEPVDLLAEYNVTAGRVRKANQDTPESLSILTRDEIELLALLTQNTSGLLRGIPGVQAGSGTSPLEANVSIRGLGDDRSPVLIDGERQNVSQGEIREDLFSVDSADIERIEVLRGPASGTYGSDATGGLINIITRQPQANTPPQVEFRSYLGGASTNYGQARLSLGGENFALSASTAYRSTGNAQDAQGNLIPNQQDNQNYNLNLRLFLDPKNTVSLRYSGYRFHTGTLAVSELPEILTQLPLVTKDRYSAEWRSQKIFDSATALKFGVFYNQLNQQFNQQVFDGENGELAFNNFTNTQVGTVGTNLQFKTPVGAGQLVYGLDVFQETGTNNFVTITGDGPTSLEPLLPNGRQRGLAAYTLLDYPLAPQVTSTIGLRYDAFTTEALATGAFAAQSVSDAAVTPKAGLVWNFLPGLRLRANYSQGFRVPTLKERFFNGTAGPLNAEIADINIGGQTPPFIILQGNPQLTSERSSSWEVGLAGTNWDVVYFNNQVSGLLNASQVGTDEETGIPIFQFGNIQNAKIQGIEAQSIFNLSEQWRLRGAFTWTDAVDQSTGTALPGIVATYGTVQISYRSPQGWAGILQTRLASAREGAGAYGVMDLSLKVPLSSALHLTFSATNLLNTFYRESLIGFNAPGRQLFAGIEWQPSN